MHYINLGDTKNSDIIKTDHFNYVDFRLTVNGILTMYLIFWPSSIGDNSI